MMHSNFDDLTQRIGQALALQADADMRNLYGFELTNEMVEVMAKDPRSFSQMMNETNNEGDMKMAIKIVLEPTDDSLLPIVVRSTADPTEVMISVGEYGADTIVQIDQLVALLEGLQSLATKVKGK